MSLIYATEFDRLFEDALTAQCRRACGRQSRSGTSTQRHEACRPRLDVYEHKDTNTVTASLELPGLISEGVTIDVHQNRLTVSGELPAQSSDSNSDSEYIVRERRTGKFSRTLQLPLGVKPEDVTAKMENGILTITFPKSTPDQLPKRIVIQ